MLQSGAVKAAAAHGGRRSSCRPTGFLAQPPDVSAGAPDTAVAPMLLPLRPPLAVWSALTPWLAVCRSVGRKRAAKISMHVRLQGCKAASWYTATKQRHATLPLHAASRTCMLNRPRVPLTVAPRRAFLDTACLPGAERPLRLRPRVCKGCGRRRAGGHDQPLSVEPLGEQCTPACMQFPLPDQKPEPLPPTWRSSSSSESSSPWRCCCCTAAVAAAAARRWLAARCEGRCGASSASSSLSTCGDGWEAER